MEANNIASNLPERIENYILTHPTCDRILLHPKDRVAYHQNLPEIKRIAGRRNISFLGDRKR